MPTTALTLLVATAGLAAVAFLLLFLHAASRGRDDADAASIAALHTYYLDLEVLEQQPTEPLPSQLPSWSLLEGAVRVSEPNLDEQGA